MFTNDVYNFDSMGIHKIQVRVREPIVNLNSSLHGKQLHHFSGITDYKTIDL